MGEAERLLEHLSFNCARVAVALAPYLALLKLEVLVLGAKNK